MTMPIDEPMPPLRILIRGLYDMQKLRVSTGNRIVANFKVRLGQIPGESEDELTPKAKEILEDLRKRHERITDAIAESPRRKNFEGDGIIDNWTEYALIEQYVVLDKNEKRQATRLGKILVGYPVYTEFLADVKGVGPMMSAVIISELDPHKARYPSSFWRYVGLDVAGDGAGRSRRKEHLVDIVYIDKDKKEATRKGITFNPFAKSKLVGVLAESFLRARDNKYADIYYGYKHRLESHPKHKDKAVGHRHKMAMRFMVKAFLADLHVKWRELEGLEVTTRYSEGKLGMEHREDDKETAGTL